MSGRPATAETIVSENVTRDTSLHSSVAQEEKKPDTNVTPPPKKSFLDSLPPWASTNLRSANSWKLLARCWLASWAAFMLLIPQASLSILGNTAFFTVMTSLFLPAYLPVQMFLFSISTLVIGVLLGWGIGAAGMRVALAARDQVHLRSTLQSAQSSAAGRANPELLFSLEIFQGDFLDIRSSIVFGCFLAIGTFFFALVRAYSPKLTLLSIFGTIAVDIFCGIGPLIPIAQYTLLNSMCTSVACYMAIAIVVTCFVFPETMNHSCLSSTSAQLGLIKSLVAMQTTVLESKPSQLAPGTPMMTKISGLRQGMLGAQKALMAKSVFINLEFSWGKWNGDDVRSLETPLMAMVTRVASLHTFARIVGEPRSQSFDIPEAGTDANVSAAPSTLPSAVPSVETLPSTTSNDAYLLHQIYRRRDSLENLHSLHIEDILPVIKNSTTDLREACIEGLDAAQASIDTVNTCRWRTDAEAAVKCSQKFDAALTRLAAALTAFKDTNRKMLIEPFMPALRDADTREARRALPLRSLYLSYVFATNLIVVGDVLLSFMEQERTTLEKRKHPRLWAPKGLRAIKKFLTQRDHEDTAAFGEDNAPEKTETGINEESYRRDPDSRPPSNVPQKIMNSIHHLYQWSKTPEALFTFKYTFVSVALWLPGVFSKTAHFYYVEKGIWALIMAQTTMNIYASDQIFNYVVRITSTFAGLCVGLATWYIGAGGGIGNHYGMAVSTAVFLVPLLWFRLFLPLQYQTGGILFCATWALIVGYSWIDGHLPIVGNPGIGWTIAWKRWTLVVIGSAASFIVMMLPPTSSRKAVRLRNASAITSISEIYGFLISTWIGTQTHQKKTLAAPATWMQDFRVKLVALADQIQTAKQMTELAEWEGSIRGKWPIEEYRALIEAELQMIGGLAQLGGALGHLEDGWRITFLHSTHVLHPNFISDVIAMFGLVANSLRTGEPMHEVLPNTLLERLFYHRHKSYLSPNSDKKDVVDIEEMQSLDYMFYCTGLVAVYHLLQGLDELHRIAKQLVGEVPLKGFDQWKNEYEQAHTLA